MGERADKGPRNPEKPLEGVEFLVVDDFGKGKLARMIARALKDPGGAVDSTTYFESGKKALEKLRSGQAHPQAIITNLEMEEMNGIELAREIRKIPDFAEIPIIMISGAFRDLDERQIEELRKLGIKGQIAKPFTANVLVEKVAGILREK